MLSKSAPKKPGIYEIVNNVTLKRYIGSTVNLYKRRNQHIGDLQNGKHRSSKLQNAFNKYGYCAFVFNVIELVEDKNNLLEREQIWIDTYSSCSNGYNVTPAAGSRLGSKVSEESKLKMSKAQTGKKQSEETKSRKNKALKGMKRSDETKRKMSEARIGYKPSKEAVEKSRNANKGRKLSEETKLKMSIAKTGVKCSDETKRKISEKNKKYAKEHITEEVRKKMYEARWLGRDYDSRKIRIKKPVVQPLNKET